MLRFMFSWENRQILHDPTKGIQHVIDQDRCICGKMMRSAEE